MKRERTYFEDWIIGLGLSNIAKLPEYLQGRFAAIFFVLWMLFRLGPVIPILFLIGFYSWKVHERRQNHKRIVKAVKSSKNSDEVISKLFGPGRKRTITRMKVGQRRRPVNRRKW